MKRILFLLTVLVTALQMSAQVSVTDFGDKLVFYEGGRQKFSIPKNQVGELTFNADSTTLKVNRLGLLGGGDYAFKTAVSNLDTANWTPYDASLTMPNLNTPAGLRDWLLFSVGMDAGGYRVSLASAYLDSADVNSTTISTQYEYTLVSGLNTGVVQGGYTVQDSMIVVPAAGNYRVQVLSTIEGGSNVAMSLALTVQDTLAGYGAEGFNTLGGSTPPQPIGFNSVLPLQASDTLRLKIRNLTSTANIGYYSLSWIVEKL